MKTTVCNESIALKGPGLARSIGLLLIGALVAGCPAGKQTPESHADGKIVLRGSNTVGEELAPRLIAAYKKSHPTAEFDLEFKGTAYGMGALMAGKCDIACASREPLKEEMELASMRKVELNDYTIGSYSVAVVVNAASSVTNLTRMQARDIFTGTVENWKDVGGPDAPIHLYIRDPISGTYLGFKELAMENQHYGHDPKLFADYGGIVQGVARDPSGIGYSSINLVKSAGVKAVTIDGIESSFVSVNKHEYPYARVLRLHTNKQAEDPAAHEFIQFVLSPQGQEVVAAAGFVPYP